MSDKSKKPLKFGEYDWNIQHAIDTATEEGFSIVQSKPNLLLLDLDSQEALDHYQAFMPLFQSRLDLTEVGRWKSQSGKHWHVVLHCAEPLDMATRIAIQAVLGSDLKREALAICMMRDGRENCSWLFRPQQ